MKTATNTKNFPASLIADRSLLTAREVKDLNKASRVLAKHGAISAARMAKILKINGGDARWRLFHIGAVLTVAELYVEVM